MCNACYWCPQHDRPLCLCSCWKYQAQCKTGLECTQQCYGYLKEKYQNKYTVEETNGISVDKPTDKSTQQNGDNNNINSPESPSTPTKQDQPNTVSKQNDFFHFGKSNSLKRKLATDNINTGENIQTTTKKICTTPSQRQIKSTNIRQPNKQSAQHDRRRTYPKICTRTSSNTDMTLPINHTRCSTQRTLDFTGKHKQQNNETRSNNENNDNIIPIRNKKNSYRIKHNIK
jgi:hypothetical protein